MEQSILFENDKCYVYRVNANRVEIRKHAGTHSEVIGSSPCEIKAIDVAKKLTPYI